jgi:hypothetical protein
MPRGCKGGFLTMLYACRAMASASGELRFARDGKPIRIQDVAKAAGCGEKDARRYLDAAVLAGVISAEGKQRGKPATYATLLHPSPDWAAAEAYLKATARGSGKNWPAEVSKDAPEREASSGHSVPNSEFGSQCPELDGQDLDGVRVTVSPVGSGHSVPRGSVHSDPNNPGFSQEQPQEMADVVPQPQERAGARVEDEFPRQQETTATAARPGGLEVGAADLTVKFCECGQRILRPDRDLCGGCLRREADEAKARKAADKPVQGAFLLPLEGGGQGIPHSRRERPQWPAEDPAMAPRLCGCGREHRLRDSDRCPACVVAAEEQRLALEVRHA